MKLSLKFENGVVKKLKIETLARAQEVISMHRIKSFKIKGKP